MRAGEKPIGETGVGGVAEMAQHQHACGCAGGEPSLRARLIRICAVQGAQRLDRFEQPVRLGQRDLKIFIEAQREEGGVHRSVASILDAKLLESLQYCFSRDTTEIAAKSRPTAAQASKMHEIETLSFAELLEIGLQLRRIASQRNERLQAEYGVVEIALAAAIGEPAIGQ